MALSALVVGLSLAIPTAAVGQTIDPAYIEPVIFPGTDYLVEKTVTTPEIPPVVDVYFLADTTGSMGNVIAQVKTDAAAVLAAIDAATDDVAFGAGNYKDFPFDFYAFSNDAAITDDGGTAALAAIATWSASGGADGSEGQFYALDQLITDANWRADATRIVVWFGDAPAHDPVCSAISGLGYDITEESLTDDLVAADIRVVAISTLTGFYLDGLDDDPTLSASNYSSYCDINGTAGQATRIADETGGAYLSGVAPGDIADAILEGISSISVEVSMTSNCEAWTGGYVTTVFDPPTQTVTSGEPAYFDEIISVAADTPGGTYYCYDWASIDDVVVGYEVKYIKVPEGFLTGGGQIGKDAKAGMNFGGNVGYLADAGFTPVGQWQFNNRSYNDGEGLKMHSTSIEEIQFLMLGGEGPEPPDANANAAYFWGEARVKVGNDPWMEGCYFDVYAEDRGEPAKKFDEPDLMSIFIWCDWTTWTYDSGPLDVGNLQIHSGLKS